MLKLRRVLLYVVVLASFLFLRGRYTGRSDGERLPVVVVGSGLAGLSAMNQLVQHGVPAVLLDKQDSFGGNSVKASSGINGAGTASQALLGVEDSPELFLEDTLKSANGRGEQALMEKLSRDSAAAIAWLKENFSLKLDLLSQLGGHSAARTHRSNTHLPPGLEIVKALTRRLKNIEREAPEKVQIRMNARVTGVQIDKSTNSVEYVVYADADNVEHRLATHHVVFATGGFGYSKDMLQQYAPALVSLPTTNGAQTTGDGQTLLAGLGAELVDMDQVQIHPTGFVDPGDRGNNWKFLAAEALRGLGGILLSPSTGKRFVNELTTRDKVTRAIITACADSGTVSLLVLSDATFQEYRASMNFYISKGLIRKLSVAALVEAFALPIAAEELAHDLVTYSTAKNDEFGRTHRINTFGAEITAETEVYVAEITPVVHFTMGGVRINEHSQVLNAEGSIVATGLYAAGEVTYGVHGANRLGGSSLLECVVYGRTAAEHIRSGL